ncbi:hypothetical protein SAMN02982919_02072 [Giesbergeria anulus]|uniref:Uncharacterized protein n=1 Tax=Giesbergeria anulus TaxID=180197 RepID=A0A1H9MVY5_9BURK|nr:hypothetical protein SAMN02982919_02072 [Giesbergeria anulus]
MHQNHVPNRQIARKPAGQRVEAFEACHKLGKGKLCVPSIFKTDDDTHARALVIRGNFSRILSLC